MARRGNKHGSRRPPVKPAGTAAPVRSDAVQALMAEAEKIDRADELSRKHGDGFVPKPRAIRRYEKYANMGD